LGRERERRWVDKGGGGGGLKGLGRGRGWVMGDRWVGLGWEGLCLGRIRSREVCIEINLFKSEEVELGMNHSVLRSRVLHSSSSDLRNRAPFRRPSLVDEFGWINQTCRNRAQFKFICRPRVASSTLSP